MTTHFDYLDRIYEMLLLFAPRIIMAILLLWIGSWIINKIVRAAELSKGRRKVDITIRPFFSSMINVVLKIMLFITIAGLFGIETTSFVAILGAASLAIGLALQGSLGHFASGVLLLIFKPYRVGDLVTIDGQTGTVEAIQIFNTVLATLDNKRIIVPNGLVTSNVITNISGQGVIRVDMTYGIADTENIDRVRQVIQGVIDGCPLVLNDRPADILVNDAKGGALNLAVRPWTNSANYWDVYFYMQENIHKAFEKNGVKAPPLALALQGEK